MKNNKSKKLDKKQRWAFAINKQTAISLGWVKFEDRELKTGVIVRKPIPNPTICPVCGCSLSRRKLNHHILKFHSDSVAAELVRMQLDKQPS